MFLAKCSNPQSKNAAPGSGILFEVTAWLLDSDFRTTNRFAGEVAESAGLESYDTVTCGVDGEVAAQLGAVAGALGEADLADDDLAGLNFLSAKQLDAKPLAGAVAGIFGGTASFHV
jgi:hypothetical protein